MNFIQVVWIAFIILAIITEAATMSLVAIWFIPSAILALFLSFTTVPVWLQVTVFFLLSLILLICTRKWVTKFLKVKQTPTNADRVIGKEAIVVEEISNIKAKGQVRVGGQVWTARTDLSDNDTEIPVGTLVEIIRIEGVKVIVAPKNKEKRGDEQ